MDNKLSLNRFYARLMQFVLPYRWIFMISMMSLAILSLTNTAFLSTIKTVTDEGFRQTNNQHSAYYLSFLLVGLLAVRAIAGFVSNYTMRLVGRRVVEDIRLSTFKHVLQLPVRFFDTNAVGLISAKITYNCEQMYNAVTKVLISAVRDTLTIIGVLGYMIYLDWRLTLIFLVITPLMALYLKKMTPKLRNSGKSLQRSIGEMTQIIEESITGQRVVKIYAGDEYEYNRFSEVVAKNRLMILRLGRISGLNSMVIELLAAVALGIVVFYAVGQFSAGEFAAFIGALLILIAPIKGLSTINEDLQTGLSAAESLFNLLDQPAENNRGKAVINTLKGQVDISNVSFTYDKNSQTVLKNLNLKIQPGEKVALVGLSGGGKSSLINLLPRFYELSIGTITIDGINIQDIPLKTLRQLFSMVSQDVTLFNDSIFNNIAYGELRSASESQVIAAAKLANAWEFIEKLPNGLHNQIGDRGVRLSGGQRQRLAIARAILKNAPILLLDEATSALDNESEFKVQEALNHLMKNKTTIIIAHRLSTIENVDRTFVLEDGEIIESGSHQALLALNGRYATLYNKQSLTS